MTTLCMTGHVSVNIYAHGIAVDTGIMSSIMVELKRGALSSIRPTEFVELARQREGDVPFYSKRVSSLRVQVCRCGRGDDRSNPHLMPSTVVTLVVP